MNYKVKQEDLKGDIKDFPIEVVQKMVDEQVRQGNKADVSVFQEQKSSLKGDFGFDWFYTRDGHEFWRDVVPAKNFDLFFSKYPKQSDLKEDNSKDDKVVVKEKKATKKTFKKLSEVKLLVTNRNRKAVVAFLDEVCNEKNKTSNSAGTLNLFKKDCYLHFSDENINNWYCPIVDDAQYIIEHKELVKLRDIKRIHAREENRKQRELEKSKLFCETVEENVSHSESEVNKVYVSPFFTDESIEKIKELVRKVGEIKNKIGKPISITCANPLSEHIIIKEGVRHVMEKEKTKINSINYLTSHNEYLKSRLDKEVKANEELGKMINQKIEVLGKREAQLDTANTNNDDLQKSLSHILRVNYEWEEKYNNQKSFKVVFLVMFLISFITLVAISLKY